MKNSFSFLQIIINILDKILQNIRYPKFRFSISIGQILTIDINAKIPRLALADILQG